MKKLIFSVVFLLFAVHSQADDRRYAVPLEDSPSCGSPNAAVTIIEFLDYQ